MSDTNTSTARDVTGIRRNPGPGVSSLASCDKCGSRVSKRVKGWSVYRLVCCACAAKREAQ